MGVLPSVRDEVSLLFQLSSALLAAGMGWGAFVLVFNNGFVLPSAQQTSALAMSLLVTALWEGKLARAVPHCSPSHSSSCKRGKKAGPEGVGSRRGPAVPRKRGSGGGSGGRGREWGGSGGGGGENGLGALIHECGARRGGGRRDGAA